MTHPYFKGIRHTFKQYAIITVLGEDCVSIFPLATGGNSTTHLVYYSLHSIAPGGGRIGIHETILGSGNLFGPLAGGLVGEYIGARAPYMLAAGVIAIALAAQAIYLRRAQAS